MKQTLFRSYVAFFLIFVSVCVNSFSTKAEEVKEPDNLYARSCVLMDGSSGRILFEKNGSQVMPMASTTKIMTLIVALENGSEQDLVTVSSYAASQPKVHLGMHAGQQFTLFDLYHSMMLESHNDSAVAIAEHIGSKKLSLPDAGERTQEESKRAVQAFADMMNEKARDIGCFDTYFITPNGLDATVLLDDKSQKSHSTTAQDLARILMYCVRVSTERERFLAITQAPSYSFTDQEGHSYQCTNHNAFLTMMDGALTGKTGFTGQAGYCYVGAVYRDQKLFIVALLACGWPNNKGYKWKDTRKLMEYGLSAYSYRQVYEKQTLDPITVKNGAGAAFGETVQVEPCMEEAQLEVLLRENEAVQISCKLPDSLNAPVQKGEVLGKAVYSISGETIATYPVFADKTVEKRSYAWCLKKLVRLLLCKA